MERYWVIEEWIPPDVAIGGKGWWDALHFDSQRDGRFDNENQARLLLRRLEQQRRTVRLMKVTRELVG